MNNFADFKHPTQEEISIDLESQFRGAVRLYLEVLLEEEMTNLIGAEKSQRLLNRKGYRNGSFVRTLLTSLGQIDVKVPRSRNGSSVGVIGEYKKRSDSVDKMATEAYISGVSTRSVGDVTEQLLGKRVSRSMASRISKRLQITVDELKTAKLKQAFPYVFVDATFISTRWARRVEKVAALVAYGVGEDGFRHLLAVEIGATESASSWTALFNRLLSNGLTGAKLIISDDHAGIKAALRECLPEVKHQRCTVHLQRNLLANCPKRLQQRVLGGAGKIFKAKNLKEAKARLAEFVRQWEKELPEVVATLKRGFPAATVFYDFPQKHHKRIHTTNAIERLNGEIKRRTKSVGAFPDRRSAERLIVAIAIKNCAIWGERKYLDMELLKEHESKTNVS